MSLQGLRTAPSGIGVFRPRRNAHQSINARRQRRVYPAGCPVPDPRSCKFFGLCAADFDRLAGAGLEADILGSASTQLVRFAARFRNLRIVIDHLPFEARDRTALRELGRSGNVFAKVSGVLRRVGRVPLDLEFYRPALDELWDWFGPDRLIYGSNWPVCNLVAPYSAVQKIVTGYFAGKGRDASEHFLWKNSQAAHRWKPRRLLDS